MRDLIAIKIKVGLHQDSGNARYPNFNLITTTVRKNMDWAHYIDRYGIGMQYDKTSGHKDDSVDSPYGQQWVCTCVPEDFAKEAANRFPNEVSIITEVEFETFYNKKAHAHEQVDNADLQVLQTIKVKKDLGLATPEKTDAFNPDHPALGIRKNHNKTLSLFKAKIGFRVIDPARIV